MGEFTSDNVYNSAIYTDEQLNFEKERLEKERLEKEKNSQKVLYVFLTERLAVLSTVELFRFQEHCENLLETKNVNDFEYSLSGDFLKFNNVEISINSLTAFINCVNRQLALRYRMNHEMNTK